MNDIQKIYEAFPNKDWNFVALLRNSSITLEFVESKSELLKNIHHYALNPNADYNFFMRYYDTIDKNPKEYARYYVKHITWDIAITNPARYKEYFMLAIDPEITWERVKNNPQYPWNLTELSKHNKFISRIWLELFAFYI